MKIDILCNVLLDTKDAQTTHIMEIFHKLRELGHEVNMTAPKTQNVAPESPDIAYFPTLHSKAMMADTIFRISALSFTYILFRLRHKKADVIYQRFSVAMMFIPLLSKLFGIPYVVEINGVMEDEMVLNKVPSIYIRFARMVERFNYQHAKKIIAVTRGVKEHIQKAYDTPENKIVVIPNGANTSLFKPMDALKAREELSLSQSDNYICFVGSLTRAQGVEYLIESVPLIMGQYPNTRFLIIGDGLMKTELVNLAEQMQLSDKVIFAGSIPYQNIPLYINASDICVAPKKPMKSGSSPLKLYEYMACGKPVVATRMSGFEVLEENNAGLLVNPENAQEFADAIIRLLRNPELRRQMGVNGRKYVVENRSWESVAKKVAEVCESVLMESADYVAGK